MAEENNKKLNISEPVEVKPTQQEATDYDAALSASLNSFYESDFETKEDSASEEKRIFAETVTYEEIQEMQAEPEPEDEAVPNDVKDLDDNDFNNIDTALASQIAGEIKKEKRLKAKKRPKLWLLSLIPILGIFVIFIRPISKYMPKWFMAIRTLIFACFAVAVMAVVATEGEFACAVAVKVVSNKFGSEIEKKTDLTKELTGVNFIEGTRVENGVINILCLVKDESNKTQMLAYAIANSTTNTLSIRFLDTDTDLSSIKYNIDGWILMDSKVVSLMIDRIGGMEVILNAKEAEFINKKVGNTTLRSGRQTLGGKNAEGFFLCDAATDSYNEGLESLVDHQMRTIRLINDYLHNKSLNNRFFFIYECIPFIQTNLPESLMIELLAQKEFSLDMASAWPVKIQEEK